MRLVPSCLLVASFALAACSPPTRPPVSADDVVVRSDVPRDVRALDGASDASDAATDADDAPAVDAGDAATDASDAARLDAGCGDAGTACGAAGCVDTQTNVANCGTCGNDCTRLPNVAMGVRCIAGRCDVTGACAPAYAHCNDNPNAGCEAMVTTPMRCGDCTTTCGGTTAMCTLQASDGSTPAYACTNGCTGMSPDRCGAICVDLRTSVDNCGACGAVCPAVPGAARTCTAGVCGFACLASRGDCNMNPVDGCEIDLSNSVENCGACATRCAGGPNATARCASNVCGLTCAANFENCDLMAANGCEIDLTSVLHCGTCATVCPTAPNARPTCGPSRVCGIVCEMDFRNCNGDSSDGCEIRGACP